MDQQLEARQPQMFGEIGRMHVDGSTLGATTQFGRKGSSPVAVAPADQQLDGGIPDQGPRNACAEIAIPPNIKTRKRPLPPRFFDADHYQQSRTVPAPQTDVYVNVNQALESGHPCC